MVGTILVTGATGTVGSEVLKQLSAKGEIIRAASRSASDNTFRNLNNVQVVQPDYNNPATIAEAFKAVDKLFLLTPFQSNMIDLTSNLVREAKNARVKHIVKLSIMGADAEPGITMSRLHRQAEKIIEESGIPFTFLRASGFMQNFVNFFGNSIKSKGAFYVPAGDGKLSFVDIRDIAAVGVKVLTDDQGVRYNGKAYPITGPEALSYGGAAEILSSEVGKKISYVDIPEESARKGLKEIGMDDWFINSLMELYAIVRAGYASDLSTAVEELTGKKPISFSQFARDYADSFK
jgi:uncharacterized protein YbjT (DUF2867 family)